MIAFVSVALLGLLALSIPVGIVLFLLGFGVDTFFSSFPLSKGLGNMVWSASNSATLIVTFAHLSFTTCSSATPVLRLGPV